MFFSPADRSTALGMYSPLYFITLIIVLLIVGFLVYLSRHMNHKQVKITLISIGIFLWLTEFGKMIFYGVTYGIKEVEFLPLYFCSMFMYACIMIAIPNVQINTTALSFIFFGGIIGAIAFFSYPNACIPNYPLFHYMTIRTFIYHGAMLYAGFLIVITDYYKPQFKDFKNYSIFLGITCALAYLFNNLLDQNLMYISQPLNMKLSQDVYNFSPALYPFIFSIMELIVPFMVSYGGYTLINKLINHKKKENDSCLD